MSKHVHIHITRDAAPLPSKSEIQAALNKPDYDKIKRYRNQLYAAQRAGTLPHDYQELLYALEEAWQER